MESPHTIILSLLQTLGIAPSSIKIDQKTVAGQGLLAIESPEVVQLLSFHPDALHSFEYLVRKIAEKVPPPSDEHDEKNHISIDVGGQRAKHLQELETRAKMMAERARSFQYDVELAPMNAYDRLVIHSVLQDSPQVKTESHGEGRARRVVIRYVS